MSVAAIRNLLHSLDRGPDAEALRQAIDSEFGTDANHYILASVTVGSEWLAALLAHERRTVLEGAKQAVLDHVRDPDDAERALAKLARLDGPYPETIQRALNDPIKPRA